VGLVDRKRSGLYFAGSRLNVPGLGIYAIKRTSGEKLEVNPQQGRIPRPSQTSTPTQTATPTPSVTPTLTPTPTATPTVTPTPSFTPTLTPTPTPTPQYNKIFEDGDDFLLMDGDVYIFENQ